MQNKAYMLLNESVYPFVIREFDIAGIEYETEQRVLDDGRLATFVAYDGCNPFIGNFIFLAGANFFKDSIFTNKI